MTALKAMHTEAKADGLLGAPVHGPNGPTMLGDLIVARGTELKGEAAAREERKAQEAPQAAAQVAAEHGADPLDRLVEQMQRCWDSRDALNQVLEDARKHGQTERTTEGPLGSLLPLGELLTNRIAELKAAYGGATERTTT